MSGNTIFAKARTRAGLAGSSMWIARAAPQMLQWAAQATPRALRARLSEEWSAHLAQLSGDAARLHFVLGCFWAATMITYESPLTASVPATDLHVPSRGASPSGRPGRLASVPLRAPIVYGSVMSEINITPLIDVMLVLLVTLIISLPTMTHAVKLDVPQGALSSTVPPTAIDVDIASDGTIAWNGTTLTGLQQLEGYLRAAARTDSQAEIHLRPERRAKYDVVAKVLALAQRNHIEKLAFVNTTEFGN